MDGEGAGGRDVDELSNDGSQLDVTEEQLQCTGMAATANATEKPNYGQKLGFEQELTEEQERLLLEGDESVDHSLLNSAMEEELLGEATTAVNNHQQQKMEKTAANKFKPKQKGPSPVLVPSEKSAADGPIKEKQMIRNQTEESGIGLISAQHRNDTTGEGTAGKGKDEEAMKKQNGRSIILKSALKRAMKRKVRVCNSDENRVAKKRVRSRSPCRSSLTISSPKSLPNGQKATKTTGTSRQEETADKTPVRSRHHEGAVKPLVALTDSKKDSRIYISTGHVQKSTSAKYSSKESSRGRPNYQEEEEEQGKQSPEDDDGYGGEDEEEQQADGQEKEEDELFVIFSQKDDQRAQEEQHQSDRDEPEKKPILTHFQAARAAGFNQAAANNHQNLCGNSTTIPSPVEKTALFVGNVPAGMNEYMFRKQFYPYGKVRSAILARDPVTGENRGFGFVSFFDEKSAEQVIARTGTIIPRGGISPFFFNYYVRRSIPNKRFAETNNESAERRNPRTSLSIQPEHRQFFPCTPVTPKKRTEQKQQPSNMSGSSSLATSLETINSGGSSATTTSNGIAHPPAPPVNRRQFFVANNNKPGQQQHPMQHGPSNKSSGRTFGFFSTRSENLSSSTCSAASEESTPVGVSNRSRYNEQQQQQMSNKRCGMTPKVRPSRNYLTSAYDARGGAAVVAQEEVSETDVEAQRHHHQQQSPAKRSMSNKQASPPVVPNFAVPPPLPPPPMPSAVNAKRDGDDAEDDVLVSSSSSDNEETMEAIYKHLFGDTFKKFMKRRRHSSRKVRFQ